MSTVCRGWTVVVPVKGLQSAKSRLTGTPVGAADLSIAFLTDVLAALRAASRVARIVVTTHDDHVSACAKKSGATVVDDTAHPGINAAALNVIRRFADDGPWAVIVSDLPGLTASVVDHILNTADALEPAGTSFIADSAGTGTTMWLTHDSENSGPAFGVDSRTAHRALGGIDLVSRSVGATGPWLPARLDVDTAADLDRLRAVGLGSATRALLGPAAPVSPVTVLRTETDDVVTATETGLIARIATTATAEARWRHVQVGQRLLVEDGSGSVPALG